MNITSPLTTLTTFLTLTLTLILLATHTLAASPNASSPTYVCSTQLNLTETYEAMQELSDICQRKGPVTQDSKLAWTIGNTRAYVCNYNFWNSTPCSLIDIINAWAMIGRACGEGVGGSYWQEAKHITYGFDLKSNEWCADLD
ncbi:hypothetical protein B0T22DRAFT_436356 [Podospora appendiculata]|uniref:Uncharacterized protein n=1 Tax=Podospora appendiculata TaxID=314037 RepID=A0AAE0XGQ7_9PEZI|nr:hypothetical protein B0T22DRAFT_436356 [Podospora appendiculata]